MNPVDRAHLLLQRGGGVHLVGVAGIGMAGLAALLTHRGLAVSGCDLRENRQTAWLREKGVEVLQGHSAHHIDTGVGWVVRSTAVTDDHPEIHRARELGIPVSRRGEVLAALVRDRVCIAVCGTHGKTTTTALLVQVLGCGYCIGGEVAGFGGVARDGETMVIEADESDGTLVGYAPDYAVITNIDYDHMEHHGSEAAFVGCFERLVEQARQKVFYRADDPIAARVCAGNPKCEPFSLPSKPIDLPLPGEHNQWNAAAALAVSRLWKGEEEILRALACAAPIRRRFETVFEGRGIRVVSDYAHHPTEIAALVRTARELKPRRLLAVFQPHRYTRTLALGADFPPSFQGVDRLWLLPVYAASEKPLAGGTTDDLRARFSREWNGRLRACQGLEEAWEKIRPELREGDLLLVVGAGDVEKIGQWAAEEL